MMRKNKIIILICALLCLTFLFAGCTPSNPETNNTVEPTVENATLKDFLSYNKYGTKVDINFAERIPEDYGKLYIDGGEVLVFEKYTKDFMNNVTVTYTFYDAETKSVFKTLTNKYEDSNFEYETDEFGNEKYPECALDIDLCYVREYSEKGLFFKVTTTLYTRLDDEIIEENELDTSYVPTLSSVVCFDRTGLEFYTSRNYPDISNTDFPYSIYGGQNTLLAYFGDVAVKFDTAENKVIDYWNAMENNPVSAFDVENEKFGYVLGASYGAVDDIYGAMGKGALEIYNKKTGELSVRYPYSKEALITNASVLNNGNVLLQIIDTVKAGEYDVLMMGQKAVIKTLVLDAYSGAVKEYPDFNYVITDLETAAEIRADKNYGAKITENVTNVAKAVYLDKKIDASNDIAEVMLFMNSDLSIQYKLEKLHPEQDLEYMPEKLVTGDLLITLKSDIAQKAIIKENGDLRTYVPFGATVTERFIVIGKDVYDFDMNPITEMLLTNDETRQETVIRTVGDNILVGAEYYSEAAGGIVTEIKVRSILAEGIADIYTFSKASIIYSDENCFIVHLAEQGKYAMYNADLEEIINTAYPISVTALEDSYVVKTGDFVFIATHTENENDWGGEEK